MNRISNKKWSLVLIGGCLQLAIIFSLLVYCMIPHLKGEELTVGATGYVTSDSFLGSYFRITYPFSSYSGDLPDPGFTDLKVGDFIYVRLNGDIDEYEFQRTMPDHGQFLRGRVNTVRLTPGKGMKAEGSRITFRVDYGLGRYFAEVESAQRGSNIKYQMRTEVGVNLKVLPSGRAVIDHLIEG